MIRISTFILATIASIATLCGFMKRLPALTVVAFIATITFIRAAPAMEIVQFDKMAFPDQKEYVIELIEGAQKVLREVGHADLSEKVARLFTTKDSEGKISIGIGQVEIAIARARVVDARNVAKDPQAVRLEVEDAVVVVMEANGIELPDSFFAVADNFRPKFPIKK